MNFSVPADPAHNQQPPVGAGELHGPLHGVDGAANLEGDHHHVATH